MPTRKRRKLRVALIREELREFRDACAAGDPVAMADALGDLLYVVYGAANECGFDMELIVDEIHASNMTKLGADGRPIYAANGKVLKGPRYRPPDLAPIILFAVKGGRKNDKTRRPQNSAKSRRRS